MKELVTRKESSTMSQQATRRHVAKEYEDFLLAAMDQGWRVETTAGGHIVFYPFNLKHQPIYAAQSPSDWRAVKNLRSRLRRSGMRGI